MTFVLHQLQRPNYPCTARGSNPNLIVDPKMETGVHRSFCRFVFTSTLRWSYALQMRAIKTVYLLAALEALTACPVREPFYSLRGTITLTNLNATGNAAISVQGSHFYATSVAVPAASNGIQSLNYSLSGVASGVYSVSVTVNAAKVNSSYYVLSNNGVQIRVGAIGYGQVWTITTQALLLDSNFQLDVAMQ